MTTIAPSHPQPQKDNLNPPPPRSDFVETLLHRFSRITSSGYYLPNIDGTRFFLLSLVVFYHLMGNYAANTPITLPTNFKLVEHVFHEGGMMALQVFFIMSGFILTLPFATRFLSGKTDLQYKRYVIRRLKRIEPPYIINLILCLLMVIIIKHQPLTQIGSHFLAGLFYLNNLIFHSMNPLNVVVWTFEIEVQFYMTAPLFCLVFFIRNVWVRRGILLLLALARVGVVILLKQAGFHYAGLTILGQLQYFLAGIFLADLYLTEWQQKPGHHIRWDIVSTIACILIFVIALNNWDSSFLLPAMMVMCYIGIFRGVLFRRITENRWLVAIGSMNYTIYLYHFFVIAFIGRFTSRLIVTQNFYINLLFQLLLILPIVLVTTSMLFLLFEKPFMYRDWVERLMKQLHLLRKPAVNT